MTKQKIRWQLPKYTMSGRAYLNHYGSRIYLDEVMRVEDKDDNSIIGTRCISNTGSYVIRERWNYGEQEFAVSIAVID